MIESKGFAYKNDGHFHEFKFERREPTSTDIVFKMLYSGICHSDLHTVKQHWSEAKLPLIPGHEMFGEVISVGKDVTKFKEGGSVSMEDLDEIEIRIGNKEYTVKVASTEEQQQVGLSKTRHLSADEGMLFVFDHVVEEGWFTMRDTSIDLDIIFIDEEGEVISVNSVKAFDPNPIEEEGYQYVLEVNIDSGIREGDEMEELNEDFSDDEKEVVSRGRMLVLDENGNVQMKLHGGERIISIKDSQRLLRKVLDAYKSDEDEDYIKVGKSIFRILDKQDSRDPEYVQLENKE